MHQAILVNKSIDDGARLVEALEQNDFPITAAFWWHLEDGTSWRLVIVSPLVDREGPLRTYGRISNLISELGNSVHFGISDISVISPSWSPFRELQREVKSAGLGRSSGPGQHGGFRDTVFEDYYIYRWNPEPAA